MHGAADRQFFLYKATPGDGLLKIPPIGLLWNIIPINKIGFNVNHYNERFYLLSCGLDRSSQDMFKPFAKAFSLKWTNVTHRVLAVVKEETVTYCQVQPPYESIAD